jgi:hypothetical protein
MKNIIQNKASVQEVVAHSNKKKADERVMKNLMHLIQADIHVERDENGVSITLRDCILWEPGRQINRPLSPNNPDKFTVTGEDYETTISELWARMRIWTQKRFGHLIFVEVRNYYNVIL